MFYLFKLSIVLFLLMGCLKITRYSNTLVIGNLGVGKSSFLNYIIGEKIFPESDLPESCTLDFVKHRT